MNSPNKHDQHGTAKRHTPSRLPQLTIVSPGHSVHPSKEGHCQIPGCVFPVAEHATGVCLVHARMRDEPEKFRSHQPTLEVLRRARYGVITPLQEKRIWEIEHAKAMGRTFLKGAA